MEAQEFERNVAEDREMDSLIRSAVGDFEDYVEPEDTGSDFVAFGEGVDSDRGYDSPDSEGRWEDSYVNFLCNHYAGKLSTK